MEDRTVTPDADGLLTVQIGDSEPMEFSVDEGERMTFTWEET